MLGNWRGRLARACIALNLAALVLVAGWVASHAYPSTEAVRLRNALLIGPGVAADFAWTPSGIPPDFKAERREPPPTFTAAARAAVAGGAKGDWNKALALAGALTRNARDLGPIQSDLVTTYRAIVEEGRGYCADFVDVYLALAHAAGMTARQWGFSFDGFGGHGHAVVEIFDRQRGRWLLLDVYNNVHAVDAASGEPLSALEFRDFVQGRRGAAIIRPNGPGRPGFPIERKLLDYYSKGANEWYLWWGNNVVTYDAHPAVRAAGSVSRALEQLAAIAAGVHPRIKVLGTPDNAPQLERMARLGSMLLAASVVAAVLLIALLVQLALWRRAPRAASAGASAQVCPADGTD